MKTYKKKQVFKTLKYWYLRSKIPIYKRIFKKKNKYINIFQIYFYN